MPRSPSPKTSDQITTVVISRASHRRLKKIKASRKWSIKTCADECIAAFPITDK